MADLTIVIVSYGTRRYLERCLRGVDDGRCEVLVVDNASPDDSAELVRERFPRVRLLELPTNLGFGAAANRGIDATRGRYVLLLNPDAWPRDDQAIPRLVACADSDLDAAVLGPRLVGTDGAKQVSRIGLPTRWWTGTPATTTVPPSPLGRLTLGLGGRGPAFVVGAALLLRRSAVEQLGGFDPDFFLFGEEVDLCLRAQRAGWKVRLCAEAVFEHVGGAAMRADWPAMYREQLRGHLRLLAKHEGTRDAERARAFLRLALRARALLAWGERRALYRDASSWLASGEVASLLASPGRTTPGRSAGAEDRTTRGAG